MKTITNDQFKIPFFVDSTSPPDHKCGGCEHRILQSGVYTCLLVNKDIDLKRGTCLLWEEGSEKYTVRDIRPSRATPATAGYVEADIVNCGSCMHFVSGICELWDGKVEKGQCCVVWENSSQGIYNDRDIRIHEGKVRYGERGGLLIPFSLVLSALALLIGALVGANITRKNVEQNQIGFLDTRLPLRPSQPKPYPTQDPTLPPAPDAQP